MFLGKYQRLLFHFKQELMCPLNKYLNRRKSKQTLEIINCRHSIYKYYGLNGKFLVYFFGYPKTTLCLPAFKLYGKKLVIKYEIPQVWSSTSDMVGVLCSPGMKEGHPLLQTSEASVHYTVTQLKEKLISR